MHITSWGTRGSVVCPELTFRYYGGNTSCVQVSEGDKNYVDERFIILDAGSGLIQLGRAILASKQYPKTYHIFLTHTHIDHLQGFVFFTPIHFKDVNISIYCPKGMQENVEHTFRHLFKAQYSPLKSLENIRAQLDFHELEPLETQKIYNFSIQPIPAAHTGSTVAYKVKESMPPSPSSSSGTKHKIFGYIPDHEADVIEKNKALLDFFSDAHLIFHDAQYTDEQYNQRKGYGHSTVSQAIENAKTLGCSVGLFHHDPYHTDEILASIDRTQIQTLENKQAANYSCFFVRDNMKIHL